MKKLLLLFFMFVLAMTAVAQRTQKITYQAVVRDAANRLVVYTPVRVDVTITSSTGSYFESLRDTTNANGLMSVEIGGNPGFEDIDWVEAVIKTVITIDGGETVTDEVTVTAVPYALTASYSLNVNPTAPTIVAIYNQMQADSLALANQIAAERAHLDDTLSHYLMQEVQVLSVSNDTLYLTGGSWVKLPQGFSGDYNDLTHLPDLSQYVTNVHLNDTLGHYPTLIVLNDSLSRYATLKTLNDTLGYYLRAGDLCDSIVKCDIFQSMRDSIQINATNIANNTTSITNNTTNITNNTTNINNITNNIASLQVVDSTLEARIVADSTNLANNYYNKDEINDTLSHYLMEEVQVLSISNDTIYLTGGSFVKLPAGFSGDYNDLVNRPTNVSAFNNDAGYLTSFTEVQALSISNDTIYLTGGSFVKLPAGFSGDYNDLTHLPDLSQYVTNGLLNDTLGYYPTLIVLKDSLSRYTTLKTLNDTLNHYLQAGDLCDSIVKCGVIQDMRDSIQINATNITHVQTDINNITGNIISLLNVDSILAAQIISDSVLFYKTDSILLARILNDSTNLANNYYNKDEINDTLSHYLMEEVQVLRLSNDTIYLTGGSFVKLPAGFSGDYNDLTNAPTRSDLCDSVKPCVTEWISDSTRMVFDTLHSRYTTLKTLSDSLRHYTTLNTLNDTLNHYIMEEVQVLRISNDTIYLTGGSFVKLPAGFSGDYNDLTNVPTKSDLCDSVKPCVTGWISDSTRMVFDTLHNRYTTLTTLSDSLSRYATLKTLNDTLSHYLMQEVQVLSVSNDTLYLTGGSWVKLPQGFSGDYNDLTNAPTNVSAFNNDAGYLTSDSAVIVNLNTNVANLQGDVTNLQNADNVLSSRITADSAVLANRIVADSTVLATRMDTLLKHVCDSVQECVTGWISDSTRMIFDTLHGRYTTLKTLNDTLSRYTTTNKIDTLISKYGYLTSDSAVIVMMRDSIQKVNAHVSVDSLVLVNRIVADSTALAHRMDTLLKHVCDSVQECVTGWISDSTRMIFDTLHSRYTTLKTLSDTLSHYTTTNQIDTLIKKYGYLTSDSAVIVMMRDSIQKVNAHVVADSLAIMDTMHRYYATNDTLKNYYTRYQVDTAKANIRNEIQNGTLTITYGGTVTTFTANQATGDNVSVTIPTPEEQVQADWKETDALKTSYIRNKPNIRDSVNRVVLDSLYAANSAMNKAIDTIARNNIHDSLTVVREMIHADSTVLATRMDTLLKHVCDSVKPCVTGWMNDTLKAYTTTNKIDTLIQKYGFATNAHLNDTLKVYTTTDKIDTLIRKYGYLTSDSAVIVMMRDSIQKVNAHVSADSMILAKRIVADSTILAHRMDTVLKHVCDSVKPCVTGWMNDTLKAYTTTNKIDTLIQKYGFATNAHLNDTLKAYTTTDKIDTLIRKYGYLTSDSAVIVMMRDSIQKVNAHVSADSMILAKRIVADSTILAHRMDTLLKHVCDSVQECVTGWMNDTLKAYTTTNKIDTLIQKYGYATTAHLNDTLRHYTTTNQIDTLIKKYGFATNAHLNDTLGKYTTTNQIDTLIKKYGYLTSDSAVIVMMRDSIQKVNAHVSADSLILANRIVVDSTALAHRMDTLLKHVCDSVQECVTGWISDSTRMVFDTLHGRYTTLKTLNDTLSRYTTTNQIDTLIQKYGFATNAHLNDTLGKYTTTDKIDTLIRKYGYLTSDSAVIVMMRDSIYKVNARLTLDSTRLADRIHSDSVVVMDTLHKYYATKDTLKNFVKKDALCTEVMACSDIQTMRDSIQKVNKHVSQDSLILAQRIHTNSVAVMDTLHKYYATKDTLKNFVKKDALCTEVMACDDIKNMRDSIQKVNKHVSQDSLILAQRIHTDSVVVMDTLHKYYATKDTLKNFVKKDALCTEVMACDDIQIMRDSIQKVNKHVSQDSLILAQRIHADSVVVMDTLHKYYATKDTLKNFVKKDALCTEVMACDDIQTMRDSIQKVNAHVSADSLILAQRIYTDSVVVMDTLHKYYATKDTLKNFVKKDALCTEVMACDDIQTMRDSIQKVNAHVSADSLVLAKRIVADSTILSHRMDTLLKHVCDSVKPCVTSWISDSTRMVFDTLHKYYTNLSTLADSMHKVDVRIKHDSLEVVELYKQAQTALQTLALTEKTDSLTLAHRMDTLLKHVCDSVKPCVTSWISDSTRMVFDTLHNRYTTLKTLKDSTTAIRGALVDTARNIRNSIGNGTLTIKQGDTELGTFNANQNDNKVIPIPVPTEPNDATLIIQKNGTTVGTFTANQATNNTINITVPTCDSLAECDLIKSILARLDKLERQNDSLAKEIEKMKPNLTVSANESVTVCSGSTLPVTYTATFHNCSSSDYTLAWKVNGVDSSAVTGAVLTLNVEEEGSYKVVCIATRSDNTSVTDTVITTVTVVDLPSFTAEVTNLTVSLTNVENTAIIQWDTDSVPVDFSGTSAEHTYSVADTITITATSENGCTFTKGLRLKATAPEVTTDSVKSVAATTAKAYGTVVSDGGVPETKRGMVYSTSDQNLELGADGVDTAMNGTGMGSYSCNLNRLVPCTQYYVRAFAFNEVDTVYGEVKNFTTPPFSCGSTLTDIDGNEYGTLLLGSQCWMQQNLRTTHFADGTEIPLGGLNNHSGPRRYAPDSNLDTYGYLYNWDAAMNGKASSAANPSGVQGACPDGWHLPSDAEWTQLTSFVASNNANVCENNPDNIAVSLASTEGWGTWGTCPTSSCKMCTNPASNNNTQFSVLPAGTWHVNAALGHINQGYAVGMAIFRTATVYEENYVRAREFYTENAYVDATAIDKTNGLSVRCVLTCPTDAAYLPTVSAVTLNATGATVSMTSNVLADGGATVTERGVCWSTSQHPTTSSTHKAASSAGTGSFTVSEDLTPGTTYYVRAYATNSEGTAYGAEVAYTTPMPKLSPTVNTGSKFIALMEGFEDSTLPSAWTTIDNDGDGNNWDIGSDPHSAGSQCILSRSWNGSALHPDNYLITPDISLPTGILSVLTFWHKGSGDPSFSNEQFMVKVGNIGASTVGDFTTLEPELTSSDEYVQKTVDLSSYAGQTIRLAFVHNDTDKEYLCIDDIVVGEDGAGDNIVSDVTATTATCGGYVSDDGGATVTAVSLSWWLFRFLLRKQRQVRLCLLSLKIKMLPSLWA